MRTIPFLSNSISRKNLMALTGLFLCLFLVIHLAGNLQLLLPPERAQTQYNFYSELLSHNYLIKFISYALYLSILAHVFDALILTLQNWRASGAQKYAYDRRSAASSWYSRNMGLLGALIFVFLVVHLKDFWFQYKFGVMPLDAEGHKDIYAVVVAAYSDLWYVGVYIASLLALGFHLLHGFSSAFESLGLYHARYGKWARAFGWIYTTLITGGFILIPIWVYLFNH
jgi:succinate dehydrogenase / fumarate reductase, cytochrome b subunit